MQISEKDGVRLLHLGGPAVQSAMRLTAPFDLELEYTRAMLAFLLFRPEAREVALIGLGGGSIAKFIHRRLPQIHLTALEINPEVVAAARAYFLLPANDARLDVWVADGADYVRQCEARLDALLVDAYDAVRIVEDLATPEFYQACLRALRPGGVAVFNLWGSDPRFEVYRARLDTVFAGHLLLLPAEKKGNIVVFAFKPPLPGLDRPLLRGRAERLEGDLGLEFTRFVDRLYSSNRPPADRPASTPG
ncbi:MAG: fused MFS/spermidine synthase [Thiobacillaceae bacterium]